MSENETDIINKPNHYARWVIQPLTYIMANGMEFWRGNVIKYATRAGYKQYDGMDMLESEITDLRKAIRNAEARIEQIKEQQSELG
jgi:hypothetical protein